MAFPNPTSGVGTAAQITLDSNAFTLSLGGSNTHQITPNLKDVAGTVQTGTVLTLSAAANASSGTTVYTGTITGGGSNAFVDFVFVVAGFATGANDGTFLCTASTATTLTLDNGSGVAETHAGTATSEDSLPLSFVSYATNVATVSATGLVTGVAKGQATVEVAYPTFSNGVGNVVSSGNVMNGLPAMKIFKEVLVTVTA